MPENNELYRLAEKYGTDKLGIYTEFYDRHLHDKRMEVTNMLEIGIFKGASLRMWADYFPNAEIVGLDINPEAVEIVNTRSLGRVVGWERITAFLVDQGSEEQLIEFLAKYNQMFDMVIDDGSHECSHQILAFNTFFPWIKPGGAFAIEDNDSSYDYGRSGHSETSVHFAQELVHAANIKDIPGGAARHRTDVKTVSFSHGVSLITKR